MDGRYRTLDGMRGIAAVIVMLGHGVVLLQPMRLPHVWLAVDLFFVLSGFVLARVYEERLAGGMTVRAFMAQRYLRLYPLFAAGMLLGIASATIALLLHRGTLPAGAIAVAGVTGLLMLPSPTWAATADVMPLDMPGWSLFFELAVNLVWAAGWRRWGRLLPWLLCPASAAGLLWIYMQGGGFGGSDWQTFLAGFPRVGFSFFAGVLIGRHLPRWRLRSDWAWVLALLLVPLFWLRAGDQVLADLLFALFASPALVAAGALIEPRRGARAMELLGAASYPIYVLHVPLLSLLVRAQRVFDQDGRLGAPWSGMLACLLIIVAALLLERLYDRPVRRRVARWLDGRRAQRLTDAATPL